MPIGRRRLITESYGALIVPGATANGAVRAGAAVALVSITGNQKLVECSSSSYFEEFLGFAKIAVADGEPVPVVTIRGSMIEPIIEGGGALTPNSPVFLSLTAGEVTQSPPATGMILRIGESVSPAQIFFNTDQRILIP
jgi:hypothetical protein